MVIEPLRGWHPNPSRFDPSELISPVYDTIGPEEHRALDARPFNAAQFTSRRSDMPVNRFTALAVRKLNAALHAQAYVRDPTPAFYVYSIEYRPEPDILETIPVEDRRPAYLLIGLVGALSLEHPEDIALHERTFPDRVEERIRLERATGMHNAPIVAGYRMENHTVNDLLENHLGLDRRRLKFDADRPPLVEAKLHGSTHRLWALTDPRLISRLRSLFRRKRVMILDGHHRFTAARQMATDGERVYPLTMLVEAHDRALLLLPWHRVVARKQRPFAALQKAALRHFPDVEPLEPDLSLPAYLEVLRGVRNQGRQGFLAVGRSSAWLARGGPLRNEGEDFQLLHRFLEGELRLEAGKFSFVRSPGEALEEARESDGTAFLLPPIAIEGVEREAFAHRFMAQKSTMFLPKVAEGLIFSHLKDP